jgi:hypothetical protein
MCAIQLVLRRCSVNVNKSTASKVAFFVGFVSEADTDFIELN